MPTGPIESIESSLKFILARTTLFPDDHLTVDIVLNPYAGAFSPSSRRDRAVDALSTFTKGLFGELRDPDRLDVQIHRTSHPLHATEITRDLINQSPPGVRLIIAAGGDGTHSEVLSAAVHDHKTVSARKGKLWFFRFPFGTGNDGADADTPAKAARVLLGGAVPAAAGHLVVRCVGSEPRYAFNIASVGLDAYVALLTNRLKGSIAGDLYKVLADVMTIFYERIVRLKDSTIRWSGPDDEVQELTRRFVLCAIGVSGERTYGDHKPVLPGFENVCAIETTSVLGKIRLKNILYRGQHPGHSIVHMKSTSRLTVEYDGRMPIQTDGEARWLSPSEFPIEFEVHDDTIPVILPS